MPQWTIIHDCAARDAYKSYSTDIREHITLSFVIIFIVFQWNTYSSFSHLKSFFRVFVSICNTFFAYFPFSDVTCRLLTVTWWLQQMVKLNMLPPDPSGELVTGIIRYHFPGANGCVSLSRSQDFTPDAWCCITSGVKGTCPCIIKHNKYMLG